MKIKTSKHHHISVHQKVEQFFRHRTVLTIILSFMAIGLIKYEVRLFGVIHDIYNQGFGMLSTYAHHEEVTRMPVQYGSAVRHTSISGQ